MPAFVHLQVLVGARDSGTLTPTIAGRVLSPRLNIGPNEHPMVALCMRFFGLPLLCAGATQDSADQEHIGCV